jgi:hypothetical protein
MDLLPSINRETCHRLTDCSPPWIKNERLLQQGLLDEEEREGFNRGPRRGTSKKLVVVDFILSSKTIDGDSIYACLFHGYLYYTDTDVEYSLCIVTYMFIHRYHC